MFPPHVTPKVDIHTTLRELVAHGERLELTTSYQGITLSHQISRIVIETDCIHFNSPAQICSLEPGQMVYFHHQSLPRSVVATISSVDWMKGGVTTSHFEFSDHIFQARKQERVKPRHPIRAILISSHNSLSTCVLNISEEGFGLLLYRVKEKNLALERIHNVQIGIRLPNTNSPIILPGTITRVCQIGNSAMASLGVQIVPTEKQARQLKSYIHSRLAEINDELASAVYRILMDPIKINDQYF